MSKNKNFHFIVPVWGNDFIELFIDVCLSMILTSGNMGIFSKKKGEDQFIILTNWQGMLTIKESSSYHRLAKMIRVEFILTDGLININNSHEAMSECYAMAMRRKSVIPGETYFVFLTPDSFWPDGTFQRLVELADQNFQVVMAAGLRVNSESVSRILKERIKQSPENPVISQTELIHLALTHFHQLSSALNWLSKSGFLNAWPSHIYWVNERDQQLIAHCFHLHPLMVLAPKTRIKIGSTIDGEFLNNLRYPLDRYYVDQGDFVGIELSPAERNWGQALEPPLLGNVIRFSLFNANRKHWYFFSKQIVLSTSSNNQIDPLLENLIEKVVRKVLRYRMLALMIQYLKIFQIRNGVKLVCKILLKLPRQLFHAIFRG